MGCVATFPSERLGGVVAGSGCLCRMAGVCASAGQLCPSVGKNTCSSPAAPHRPGAGQPAPQRVPARAWACEMGAREEGEDKDGEIKRLKQRRTLCQAERC